MLPHMYKHTWALQCLKPQCNKIEGVCAHMCLWDLCQSWHGWMPVYGPPERGPRAQQIGTPLFLVPPACVYALACSCGEQANVNLCLCACVCVFFWNLLVTSGVKVRRGVVLLLSLAFSWLYMSMFFSQVHILFVFFSLQFQTNHTVISTLHSSLQKDQKQKERQKYCLYVPNSSLGMIFSDNLRSKVVTLVCFLAEDKKPEVE